jgi:hypothetical protein
MLALLAEQGVDPELAAFAARLATRASADPELLRQECEEWAARLRRARSRAAPAVFS